MVAVGSQPYKSHNESGKNKRRAPWGLHAPVQMTKQITTMELGAPVKNKNF
jgi:hypothetical protein